MEAASNLLQQALMLAFDTTWQLITPENIGQAIGALAAMLAMIISLTHILRHWKYNKTKLRKSTVRLLFIVPIFALDCWACLMLEASIFEWAEVLTWIREVYEAIALLSFMELVLTILGGTENLSKALLKDATPDESAPQVQHVWPLCMVLPAYKQGPEFLRGVLYGIFQYAFVTLTCLTMVSLISVLHYAGILDPFVVKILDSAAKGLKAISCAWALNCLLLFAREVHAHVPRCGLFLKFLSIKGIVFFTFWQGSVIWFLQVTGGFEEGRGYITRKASEHGLDKGSWDRNELKSGLNDFLLCLEVLLFAILHLFAYPAREAQHLPDSVKSRMGNWVADGPERVFSAVNLTNLVELKREVDRIEDLQPRAARGRSWIGAFATGSGGQWSNPPSEVVRPLVSSAPEVQ